MAKALASLKQVVSNTSTGAPELMFVVDVVGASGTRPQQTSVRILLSTIASSGYATAVTDAVVAAAASDLTTPITLNRTDVYMSSLTQGS